MDKPNETAISTSVQIAKSAEKTTPEYLKQFLLNNAPGITMAIRKGDETELIKYLQQFSKILPKGASFREILAAICVRKNGNLFVTCVEGNFEMIGLKEAQDLLDDIIQFVPMDTEQILFIHDHPSEQNELGPVSAYDVGFSSKDINSFAYLGSMLRIFDLKNVFIGLSTSNSSKVVLEKGQGLGKTYGWEFFSENKP